MLRVRAAGLVCCAALMLATGCATQFASEPPAGVSLAGHWKIDHAASDDPQKILAEMRAQALKIMSRRQGAASAAPPPSRGGGQRTAGGADSVPPEDLAPPPPGPGGRPPDPLRRSPMAHVILQAIGRGDFLTIREGPGEFVLDYGTSVRRFTAGVHSVVSAEGGVGDQVSGWQGHAYVIQIRPQQGPEVTEKYSRAADGRRLIETLHIASDELSAVTLTRVYVPTSETAPRELPSND